MALEKPLSQSIVVRYRDALEQLRKNIGQVHRYPHDVLIEGGAYKGVWLECAPMEGMLYCRHNPEIARANHDVFFALQGEDGYLPCWVRANETGTAQIQMTVPIAATALEAAELLRDESFLDRSYHACVRWDQWLRRYRDTRNTGLCEAFCEWDTGHDHSPRFRGIPEACPGNDARRCPDHPLLPFLAPDLSASVYGGRMALARMATLLNKGSEAQRWLDDAEQIRGAILEHCFDPEDECFYDVDRVGNRVRVKGDLLTRVLGEHVVDQSLFDLIYNRHIRNPESFWTPYPLPSIAIDDPLFDRTLPPNSWGGASQALTALRSSRWFDFYGKTDDLEHLMRRWVEAIVEAPDFMQQMNPWTGEFSTSPAYSPCMLVFTSFVERLWPELTMP